jgi:[protein-PII] uridylyltransferase
MPEPLQSPTAAARQVSVPRESAAIASAAGLRAGLNQAGSAAAAGGLCRQFLTTEEQAIRVRHEQGGGGLEIARARAALLDELFAALLDSPRCGVPGIAIVARGAYGRGTLNPQAEIRVTLLTPGPSSSLPHGIQSRIYELAECIAQLGLRLALAPLSVAECLALATSDPAFKTSLLDARLVAGDAALGAELAAGFERGWLGGGSAEFFDERRRDLRSRHQKFSRTVFLQEPNVKESCGGLDDYHNLRWVCRVKQGTSDLAALVASGILTATGQQEIMAAVDFLHRVRNELHYHTQAPTDQLTLMLQGVVASAFRYPQRSILRRTEALMRDYYRHTLNLYQHSSAVMEQFQIEQEDRADDGLRSFLTFRTKPEETFDGFIARDGRIHPVAPDVFQEDPHRLMRLFQHCQVRQLRLSPQLRQLVRDQLPHIDRAFRYSKANRETFQAILERKGDVATALRRMHRCGFLGRYLPEFEPLDCLVQHEFFHRYTADEHTLRCLDWLDQLVGEPAPNREIFRRLFHEIADPYALYLAVILHDTGRAENVREHIDGSALLASRLCNRLQIRGPRRTLIMFLVDNHLTFWRTATTRNLEDPEVIAEFAAIVKTRSNLDALFLFTYADSNATSPESWTGWKESLMLQLYSSTRRFLDGGDRAEYARQLDADRLALRDEVRGLMRPDYHPDIALHFERMPAAAFHFRQAANVVTQIRSVRHFLPAEAAKNDRFAHCIKWIDHPGKGYSELILATRDKPLLLEKLCCALAARHLNILSADFFTRSDGIVVDVFRVCTTDFEPVADPALRKDFLDCFDAILRAATYDPERHLHRQAAQLLPRASQEITVPVLAYVTNKLHPTCTTVEIQAMDRIGVLHDLFHAINQHGLTTAHARICTEKGVAMDTLYITTPDGRKVTDPEVLESLNHRLSVLIGCPEVAG